MSNLEDESLGEMGEADFDLSNNTNETGHETNNSTKPSYVYLLICSDGSASYVGATVDLDHRLKQHNGILKGGAVATTSKLTRGRTWIRAAHVSGFPDWKSALQFEWRWKQLTRKYLKLNDFPIGNSLDRRLFALGELIRMERATTKAVPYAEWPGGPPRVHLETPEAEQIWKCVI